MARTAVIAGTATAVHGSMTGKKQSKAQAEAQAQADAQAAQQATYDTQAQLADMQRQLDESEAAQVAQQASTEHQAELADMQRQLDEAKAAEAPAAPQAAPASAAGDDLMAQLSKLADLKAAGVLSDQEFASAKAKLLGM